jgi:hypothetical protein
MDGVDFSRSEMENKQREILFGLISLRKNDNAPKLIMDLNNSETGGVSQVS